MSGIRMRVIRKLPPHREDSSEGGKQQALRIAVGELRSSRW